MLVRSWGFMGVIAAALVMGGFFAVLLAGGWRSGAATGPGAPLHDVYRQATTVTWLGIVACQVGAAFAARTERASLRMIGLGTNRPLLAGIGVALCFAAALVYAPPLQGVFGTAALSPGQVALVLPFPLMIWGADELRRRRARRRAARC